MEMDADFVKTLVQEVKSQGVFDQFRMDSLADVDTKPAYQNVRNRVETNVKDFLAKQTWTPDTNKVQLREKLRKHLLDSDILDKGAISIVDQAVNPKIATMFEPKIESIVYKYLGITPPPPPANVPPPRPPLLPAPPMPPFPNHHLNGGSMLKVETTASLLPTDLEQISPDSDRATIKSDPKDDTKEDDLPPGVDADDQPLDDDTSPSFEPLSEDKPNDSDIKDDTNNGSLNASNSCNKELVTDSRDAGASQTSQLSQVSSDSRLTIASNESAIDAQQPINNSVESTTNITANISEEAQMPKFNENSSDTNGCEISGQELHFDIKKDAIKFEGTERKNSMSGLTPASSNGQNEMSIEDAIMSEVEANIIDANNAAIAPDPTAAEPVLPKIELPLTPQLADSSLSSFSDAQQSLQNVKASPETMPDKKENNIKNGHTSSAIEASPVNGNEGKDIIIDDAEKDKKELTPVKIDEIKEMSRDVTDSVEESATNTTDIVKKLSASEENKEELNKSAESTTSPASSLSNHKKHSSRDKERRHYSDDKHRRRSRERERERERRHSRDKSHSKHSSSSNSKHSSSSSSRHKSSKSDKSMSTSSSRSSGVHDTSSSKRPASTFSRSESSHKKHTSSRSERDSHNRSSHSRSHNGSTSSSSTSKRSDRGRDRERDRDRPKTSSSSAPANQDDHNEAKNKVQKRRSHDSNDEGKSFGSGSSSSSSAPKTKENAEPASASDTNGTTNCTDGSNGTHDEVASMSSSNVIVVSDMLQQSSTSFIQLGSSIQISKTLENSKCELVKEQTDGEKSEADMEKPVEKAKDLKEEVVKENWVEEKEADFKENKIDKVEAEHKENKIEKVEPEHKENKVEKEEQDDKEDKETKVEKEAQNDSENKLEGEVKVEKELVETPIDKPSLEENPAITVADNNDETASFTHFEDDNDEFKSRLELIERLIEQRRNVLNVFGEDEPQAWLRARALQRSLSKRELQDTMEPKSPSSTSHIGSITDDSNNNSGSGADSATAAGATTHTAKRLRRCESKTSPTPSDTSVNSKENDHNDDMSKRLISASAAALSKLCQQQRYTNDDLYKPRTMLSQRSRRRGLDSIL